MREIIEIYSENPAEELWQYASFLESRPKAQEFLRQRHATTLQSGTSLDLAGLAESLIYSLKQAREYYHAASAVGSLTRPLLLFYGMLSLAKALILSRIPSYPENPNKDLLHGVTPQKVKPVPYVFVDDFVTVKPSGMFPILHSLVSTQVLGGETFTIRELLSIIPELSDSFSKTYALNSLAFRVEISLLPLWIWVRIPLKFLQDRGLSFSDLPDNIPRLGALKMQGRGLQIFEKAQEVVVAWQPTSAESVQAEVLELVDRGVFGDQYLTTFLRGDIWLPELSAHYLLMFALGMLARYHAEVWAQITMGPSEDMYVINKFLAVSKRKFPNLILNELFDQHIIFMQPTTQI